MCHHTWHVSGHLLFLFIINNICEQIFITSIIIIIIKNIPVFFLYTPIKPGIIRKPTIANGHLIAYSAIGLQGEDIRFCKKILNLNKPFQPEFSHRNTGISVNFISLNNLLSNLDPGGGFGRFDCAVVAACPVPDGGAAADGCVGVAVTASDIFVLVVCVVGSTLFIFTTKISKLPLKVFFWQHQTKQLDQKKQLQHSS